jgi:hypothetical protein
LGLSNTGILAGEAGGDDIAWDAIEAFNVTISRYIGPPMGENLSAKDVDLAERDGSHSSSFKSETEAADSRKQIQHSKLLHGACSCMISDMKRTKHCGQCGAGFEPTNAWQKFCSFDCQQKFRNDRKPRKLLATGRHCRQCGTKFFPAGRGESNKWHCSPECAVQSARESRSKFYAKKPEKYREYHAKSREKRGPDSNLKRFYARHPEAPRACQSCGEGRVLDVAHKPEHRRNGAWRSKTNTTIDRVWILCPTCHALLDRMHYPPADLGLS